MIKAVFDDYNDFKKALTSLFEAGHKEYEVYSPVDLQDVEDLMPKKGSTVHIYAMIGAITGLALFFFMCVYASQLFGQVVGGKPPISRTPFVIVSYEGTILFGAIFAFFAAVILAKLQPWKSLAKHDTRFSGNHFGIEIQSKFDNNFQIISLLVANGAIEINEIE